LFYAAASSFRVNNQVQVRRRQRRLLQRPLNPRREARRYKKKEKIFITKISIKKRKSLRTILH